MGKYSKLVEVFSKKGWSKKTIEYHY